MQITLREYGQDDVSRLVELANNQNVSRYLIDTFPFPYTTKNAEWWIREGQALGESITWAIEWNGDLVGGVGLTPQSGWRGHIAEIGYWLGEPYWGQGLATAAVESMTQRAFQQHGFRKIIAPVLGPNLASIRVLAKCGYDLEGVLKAEVRRDGQFYDAHRYAKYRP